MNYLSKNIKLLRDHLSLSQEEFGAIVGASRGMIAQYENRGSSPNNAIVTKIEAIVNVPKDVLMSRELTIEELNSISKEGLENVYVIRRIELDKILSDAAKERLKIEQSPQRAVELEKKVATLEIQNEELKKEVEKLEAENIDISRRFVDANKDYFEATKETLELMSENKALINGVKLFMEYLNSIDLHDNGKLTDKFQKLVLNNLKKRIGTETLR